MTFTSKTGDVAYFVGCVEGGDPYRVTVSYRHATGGWHNIESGLRLDDTHPGLANLYLLVRDHRAITETDVRVENIVSDDASVNVAAGAGDQDALNIQNLPVAHLGSMPLVLSFEPEAIREHFDEDRDMSVFTDAQLAAVGLAALTDDALYNTFHDTLKWAMSEVQSNTSDDPATPAEDPAASGPHEYLCTYEISSLMDDHDSIVGTGELLVNAHDHRDAINKASAWVRDNDYRYDERIDPRVTINDVIRKD